MSCDLKNPQRCNPRGEDECIECCACENNRAPKFFYLTFSGIANAGECTDCTDRNGVPIKLTFLSETPGEGTCFCMWSGPLKFECMIGPIPINFTIYYDEGMNETTLEVVAAFWFSFSKTFSGRLDCFAINESLNFNYDTGLACDFTEATATVVSGGGQEKCPLIVPCCPETPLPRTLHVTSESDCEALDGIDYTLEFDDDAQAWFLKLGDNHFTDYPPANCLAALFWAIVEPAPYPWGILLVCDESSGDFLIGGYTGSPANGLNEGIALAAAAPTCTPFELEMSVDMGLFDTDAPPFTTGQPCDGCTTGTSLTLTITE